ncbi:hypothetical protein VRRI112168_02760 [Vreelandella rituensis]
MRAKNKAKDCSNQWFRPKTKGDVSFLIVAIAGLLLRLPAPDLIGFLAILGPGMQSANFDF